jgi:hypothetical protein
VQGEGRRHSGVYEGGEQAEDGQEVVEDRHGGFSPAGL